VVAVFKEWMARGFWTGGLLAAQELLVFTLILVAGLAWMWLHGDLEWVKRLAEPPRPHRARERPVAASAPGARADSP